MGDARRHAKINGEAVPVFSSPSSYLTVTRSWKDGDRIELSLPMSLHVHPMPDDPTLQAMMYGPLVLAGRLGNQGLDSNIEHPGVRYRTHGPAGPSARGRDERQGSLRMGGTRIG